jgi:hypothetical protein
MVRRERERNVNVRLYALASAHTLKREYRTSKSLSFSFFFFFYSIGKLLLRLLGVIEEERCKLGWTSAREKKKNSYYSFDESPLTFSFSLYYLSAVHAYPSLYSSTCRLSVSFSFPS